MKVDLGYAWEAKNGVHRPIGTRRDGAPIWPIAGGSGTDFVFNIAKGKVKYYCELPAANDALIIVVLKTTGLEADSTMKDYDDLAALLAGASDEVTNTGYARKVITAAVSVPAPDDTNDRLDIDITTDPSWTAVASGDVWAKLLVCYDPDTTGGTDSSIIPLTAHSFDVTPDGSDISAVVATTGFFRAS